MASFGGSATETPPAAGSSKRSAKNPPGTKPSAEKELRRRLVDVERDGYRKPETLTLARFAERWQTEHLPGRGLKLTTLANYQQTLRNHLLPALGHHTLTTPRTHTPN